MSADTALLFLTLVQPGPCPAFVRGAVGDRFADAIGRLILDQVLEVERDGEFGRAERPGDEPDRTIAEAGGPTLHPGVALRQELRGLTPEMLGLRLYLFGRRPITPELRRRLPDEAAVDALIVGHGAVGTLSRYWVEAAQVDNRPPWRSWHPKPVKRAHATPVGAPPATVRPSSCT